MDILDACSILYRRICIWHTDYRGETASYRCCRTTCDSLFFLIARLTEMHMNINKPGRNEFTGRIDHLGIRRVYFPDLGKIAVPYQNVAYRVNTISRV